MFSVCSSQFIPYSVLKLFLGSNPGKVSQCLRVGRNIKYNLRKPYFTPWKCTVFMIELLLFAPKRFCPSFGDPNMHPFQGDNKKMEDAKFYLTLPGSKVEMEEKELQASKTLANFTPAKDSTKDSFQIATLICSTKLTQNGRCGDHTDTILSFLFGLPGSNQDMGLCLPTWDAGPFGFYSLFFTWHSQN